MNIELFYIIMIITKHIFISINLNDIYIYIYLNHNIVCREFYLSTTSQGNSTRINVFVKKIHLSFYLFRNT